MLKDRYEIRNFINDEWVNDTLENRPVINPATGTEIGLVPQSSKDDVNKAVIAAKHAFTSWRRVPPGDRIQYLFKLKQLMERELDELSSVITLENGKVLSESVGELKRAIENVEVACGIPTMMLGDVLEDVSSGIDELMIRQPLGVCGIICPFRE